MLYSFRMGISIIHYVLAPIYLIFVLLIFSVTPVDTNHDNSNILIFTNLLFWVCAIPRFIQPKAHLHFGKNKTTSNFSLTRGKKNRQISFALAFITCWIYPILLIASQSFNSVFLLLQTYQYTLLFATILFFSDVIGHEFIPFFFKKFISKK